MQCWRSTSWLEGKALTFQFQLNWRLSSYNSLAASGDELFGAGLAVEWEDLNDNVEVYVVQVAEQREAFDTRVAAFRADLIHWLVVAVVALIFVQRRCLQAVWPRFGVPQTLRRAMANASDSGRLPDRIATTRQFAQYADGGKRTSNGAISARIGRSRAFAKNASCGDALSVARLGEGTA